MLAAEKIFIGTQARSYLANASHKRRLRKILIDSRDLDELFYPTATAMKNRVPDDFAMGKPGIFKRRETPRWNASIKKLMCT